MRHHQAKRDVDWDNDFSVEWDTYNKENKRKQSKSAKLKQEEDEDDKLHSFLEEKIQSPLRNLMKMFQ